MNDRDTQFLNFYEVCRVQDQMRFYKSRRADYEAAHTQIVVMTGILLILTATVGVLSATNAGGAKDLWGVLAVALPALSTALTGYDGLYAFERHAKLYGDVANALTLARVAAPVPQPSMAVSEAESIVAYVRQVEGIFQREQGQWGQLIHELPSPDSHIST